MCCSTVVYLNKESYVLSPPPWFLKIPWKVHRENYRGTLDLGFFRAGAATCQQEKQARFLEFTVGERRA